MRTSRPDERDPRLARLEQIAAWSKNDPGVKSIVSTVVAGHDASDLGELALNDPALFDELYEVVTDMLEQMPTSTDPGFVR
jgi:hypothetical protein